MSIFKSLKIKVLSQISRNSVESQSYLKETFDLFTDRHSESLERLKTFRDKIGAHSDSNVNIKNLPSHAEFETLFNFAYDFYALICRTIIGNSPAVVQETQVRAS